MQADEDSSNLNCIRMLKAGRDETASQWASLRAQNRFAVAEALRSQRGEPCLPDTRPVSVRHGPPQSLPARPEAALRSIAREAPG